MHVHLYIFIYISQMYKNFSLILYITSVVLVFHLQSIRMVLDEAGEVLTKKTDSVLYSPVQSSFFPFSEEVLLFNMQFEEFSLCFKILLGDFPGSPVVKTLRFHCRGWGSIPRWGTKIPYAAWCGQ